MVSLFERQADGQPLTPAERACLTERYNHCAPERVHGTADLVLAVAREFEETRPGRTKEVADTLQRAVIYLRRVTQISLRLSGNRLVVGYRLENPPCSPGFDIRPFANSEVGWINVPWHYKDHQNKPLACCSHELVHPFFHFSPLHRNKNEAWGDGYCDFLRGPVLEVMGLDGRAWTRSMICCAHGKGDQYHDPAGQFALAARARVGDIFDAQCMTQFLSWLHGIEDLNKVFLPSPEILAWQLSRGR